MYKLEYKIPYNDVSVEINGLKVKVKGIKGEIEKEFKTFLPIKIEKKDDKIIVYYEKDKRKYRALAGSIIAHIRNMIEDSRTGYYAKLKAVYMHFPVKIELKGNSLIIKNFLGDKANRIVEIPKNLKVSVSGDEIKIEGIYREDVMGLASKIEQICRITGYDRRVFLDGIYITESGKIS